MTVSTVRRIAADILKVGKSRVWISPERVDEVESAVTREDVRRLIKDGAIAKRPSSAPSRGRKRLFAQERRAGRHGGAGSRKGAKGARRPRTLEWPARVRALRRTLRKLMDSGKIESARYRSLYLQIKGGRFSSKRELLDQAVPAKRRVRKARR